MSVAVGSRWMTLSPHPHSHSLYHHSNPHTQDTQIPPRNEVELSREMLITVLTHFSTLLPSEFGNTPIRLVVHGGACMLLHPGLHKLAQQQAYSSYSQGGDTIPRRTNTRDVDIIQRSFVTEYRGLGIPDPAERLQRCIRATAKHFRLGADWMNNDADIALPMAVDPATSRQYDPIYSASIQPNNIHIHTIFTSPNRLLTLISVTPFWAVALKLVRYTRWDPGDIRLLLRNGTNTIGTKWSPERVEEWLLKLCWPMGYSNYPPKQIQDMRAKIAHAVQCLPDHEKCGPISRAKSPPSVPPMPTHPSWVIPPAPAPLHDFSSCGWSDQSHNGSWHSLPPSEHSSPSGWGQTSLQRHTEDSFLSNRTVDEFDRSISMMLGSQTNAAPRHEMSEQHSRKLWRKKEQKKKHNNRRTSRRIKLMLGWSVPDDSDSDEGRDNREEEDSSDSDDDSNDDDSPAHPSEFPRHDHFGQSRAPSHRAWGHPPIHQIPVSQNSSPHIINQPPMETFHVSPPPVMPPHHHVHDSFHQPAHSPPPQPHRSFNSLGISI